MREKVSGTIAARVELSLTPFSELDLITFGVGVAVKKSFGGEHTGFFVGGRAGRGAPHRAVARRR
jgi:hypothetical protein